MNSTSETGHAVNVDHFKKLTDVVTTFGTAYAPVSDHLKITSLNNLYTAAAQALEHVDELNPPWLNAVDARILAFEPLDKQITRVLFVAETIPLNATALKALKELVRKIHGTRAKPKVLFTPAEDPNNTTDPDTPANTEPPHRYISVSQRSFTQRVEHFNQAVELLKAEPEYLPSEADLTLSALEQLLADMRATNEAAVEAAIPLDAARRARNIVLYAPRTGLVDTALAVKKYVKGAFGFDSPEYAQVKTIEFRRVK
ncbi:MAG: hypothetical protein LBF19_04035 [Prevotellaceae bacterium]|jgi:hypothetical protein|nr:hypothetical protein [Prevotellaceae bacterium]